jgi:pimeloyl-ACP methyl ester carboxylesterase
MVAQEFAVTNPGRVERLALACTSAGGEGGSSYPLQKLLELPREQRVASELKSADSRWDQRWLEAHWVPAPIQRTTADRGLPGSCPKRARWSGKAGRVTVTQGRADLAADLAPSR